MGAVVTGGTTVVEGDHAEDQEEEEVSSANPDMSHVSVVVLGEASIQVIDSSLTTGIQFAPNHRSLEWH